MKCFPTVKREAVERRGLILGVEQERCEWLQTVRESLG
jgi:hypothetical protein